jgi:hypothetical protein
MVLLYEISLLFERNKLINEYEKIISLLKQIYVHLVKIRYSDSNLKCHHIGDIISWCDEVHIIIHKNSKIKLKRLVNLIDLDNFKNEALKILQKKYHININKIVLDEEIEKLNRVIELLFSKTKFDKEYLESILKEN